MGVPVFGDEVGLGFYFYSVGFQESHFILDEAGLAGDAEVEAGAGGEGVFFEHDDVDACAVEEFHDVGDVAGEA